MDQPAAAGNKDVYFLNMLPQHLEIIVQSAKNTGLFAVEHCCNDNVLLQPGVPARTS
jgi:hypothetical protein